MRDDKAKFEQANAAVFGVNDASVAEHKKYAEKYRFNFPLLSDADRNVAKMFGAVNDDGKGVRRTVVILDKEGTIRYHKYGMPSDQELLEEVKKL